MNEDLCPIYDLPTAWCAHCRGLDLPKPPPLVWFSARFEGLCAVCHQRIEVGDHIASADEGYICRRRHEHQ